MTQGLLRKNNLSDIASPNEALKNLGLNPVDYERIKGLYATESRTNLLRWSEKFSDLVWVVVDGIVHENVGIAPNGTLTADLVQITGSAIFSQSVAKTMNPRRYTASIYVKGVIANLRLGVFDAVTNNGSAEFNLTSGTLTSTSLTGDFVDVDGSIVSLPDDWYRISATATTNFGGTVRIRVSWSVGEPSLLVWGAQLEEANSASDYIGPTATTSLTRNQAGISNKEVQLIAGSIANYQVQLDGATAALSGIVLDNFVSRSGDTISGTWTNAGTIGAQQVVFSGGTPTASTCAVFTHQSGEGQFRLTASSVTANNGITVERFVDSGNTVVASGVVPTRRIPITIAGTTYFMEAG
jgi:hypothetical protein